MTHLISRAHKAMTNPPRRAADITIASRTAGRVGQHHVEAELIMSQLRTMVR